MNKYEYYLIIHNFIWEGKLMADFRTVSVRMPIETFYKLRKMVATEHRSINQQINLFLENALAMLEEEQEKKETVEAK